MARWSAWPKLQFPHRGIHNAMADRRFATIPAWKLSSPLAPISASASSDSSGCSVGPKYSKPTTEIPPAYKENANWKPAQPSDQTQKGNWWEIFQDPQLNALEEKLRVSNQSLRAAVDRFQESRDVLRETRSSYFPLVTASVTASQNRESVKIERCSAALLPSIFGFDPSRRCLLRGGRLGKRPATPWNPAARWRKPRPRIWRQFA